MVWLFGGSCRSPARLDGKTAVVTGADAGIGKETALDLARRGARVVMAGCDLVRAEAAAADIRRQLEKHRNKDGVAVGEVVLERLDLASLRSVRACARRILEREERLSILVNNAGVFGVEARTEDGFEMHFGVNYLGHFLLTLLLLPRLRASAPSRVVNVSSAAYSFNRIDFDDLRFENNYSHMAAYARSKLAIVLFTRELARRLREAGVDDVATYSVHPGFVGQTEIVKRLIGSKMYAFLTPLSLAVAKSPRQGAQTSIHCAVDERAGRESGLYYVDCKARTPRACGRDDATALRLWDVSVDLVGLRGYDAVTASEAPSWHPLDAEEKEAKEAAGSSERGAQAPRPREP